MDRHFLIAIDGPSGAGKSTVAHALAEEFNIMHLDTGALFRALAYAALEAGLDSQDPDQSAALLDQVTLEIIFKDKKQKVLINGKDITSKIRTEEVSLAASNISVHPTVRNYILEKERELAEKESFVLDGRDIGTVVLPNADLKIFLLASPEIRAQRRLSDLLNAGISNTDYDQVLEDIKKRDAQDSNRDTAPTKKADDAILIDSSELSLEETISMIKDIVAKKLETGNLNS
ncbi:MAG: (d)CMP kinase [Saccharofermentanales bacterium]|jgi:cytidylate kinase|nr:(d)CMP kinase [Bacillota bacterium]